MQSPIRVQPEGRHINVYFTYNEDLVRIMQENNGWWRSKQECWMFPASHKEKIVNILEEGGYKVLNVPEHNAWRKAIKKEYHYEPFKDEKEVHVWGLCRKCNSKCFINKECLCGKCELE